MNCLTMFGMVSAAIVPFKTLLTVMGSCGLMERALDL